jgi:hypothetical protein
VRLANHDEHRISRGRAAVVLVLPVCYMIGVICTFWIGNQGFAASLLWGFAEMVATGLVVYAVVCYLVIPGVALAKALTQWMHKPVLGPGAHEVLYDADLGGHIHASNCWCRRESS